MNRWLRFFDALSRGDRRSVRLLVAWIAVVLLMALSLSLIPNS